MKLIKTHRTPRTRSGAANARLLPTEDLQITDAAAAEIMARLKRVEGQVRAIQRLITERRDCHLIAQQLSAAKVAFGRAGVQLMASQMAACVRRDEDGVDGREIQRLTSTFMKMLA